MEDEFLGIKKSGEAVISGSLAFKYYDEKGIPLDLIEEKAVLHGLKLDSEGFNNLLDEQRSRSRRASKVAGSIFVEKFSSDKKTEFIENAPSVKAKILAVSKEGETIHIALDKTVFYGESGGQVGDTGLIEAPDLKIEIKDAKRYLDTIDHIGIIKKGEPKPGDAVTVKIDLDRRCRITRNHTATHLLHTALKKVLGKHVNQYGSLVAPGRLRFDFTHPAKVSPLELQKIEALVTSFIKGKHKVAAKRMALEAAKKEGAIALFGEKYSDTVTVRSIGSVSKELCGGVHVSNTKDIGVFKIISEMSVASGVRRIEALTGEAVYEWMKQDMEGLLSSYKAALKDIKDLGDDESRQALKKVSDYLEERLITIDSLIEKDISKAKEADLSLWLDTLKPELKRAIEDLEKESKWIQKRQKKSRELNYESEISSIAKGAREIQGFKVVSKELQGMDMDDLRKLADMVKKELKSAVVVLAAKKENRANIVFGVTKDLVTKGLSAGKLIKEVAAVVGGSGGGRPDMAQAGGKDPQKLGEALELVYEVIKREVSK